MEHSFPARFVRATTRYVSTASGLDKQHRVLSYSLGYLIGPNVPGRYGEIIKALGGAIVMARYVNRFGDLWYYWSTLFASPSHRDALMRVLLRLQDYALLLYQKAEIVSWVGYTSPKARLDADWWMRLSCWAWVGWIVLDVVRVLRTVQLRVRESVKALTPPAATSGIDGTPSLPPSPSSLTRAECTALADAACAFPMALSWASDFPQFSRTTMGLLGLASALISGHSRWQSVWAETSPVTN